MKGITALLSIMVPLSCLGVVNYKNGNYFQEFTDLASPLAEGTTVNFKRSYNSASDFVGIFGKGWGSTFETQIQFLPNTIIVKEMGNGKNYLFTQKDVTAEKGLEEAFKILKEKNLLKEENFERFKTRLLLDPSALGNEISEVVKDPIVANGEYVCLEDPRQKIMLKDKSVVYTDSGRNIWDFDRDKGLTSWTHASGVKFDVKTEQGKIVSLISKKMFIQFVRNPQDHLETVMFGPHQASYVVGKTGVEKSIDQNKETYSYEYSDERLSKVKGKEFSEEVKYNPSTGEVSSVIDSEGKTTKYKFIAQNIPNIMRRAEVTKEGEVPSVYEYEERIGKFGPYLYRRLLKKGNRQQQIVFDDCCGRPLSINEGGKVTEIIYNLDGTPASMRGPDGEISTWSWNDKGQLETFKSPSDERKYSYDKFGANLVISKSLGAIAILRDGSGQITESTLTSKDGTKTIIKFSYSPDKKTMLMTNAKGMKAYVKEVSPENWVVDNTKKNDLKAKLDLLNWLNRYEQMVRPPQPQNEVPTI